MLKCSHRSFLSLSCTPRAQRSGVGGGRQRQGSLSFHINPRHSREAVPYHRVKQGLFPEELQEEFSEESLRSSSACSQGHLRSDFQSPSCIRQQRHIFSCISPQLSSQHPGPSPFISPLHVLRALRLKPAMVNLFACH